MFEPLQLRHRQMPYALTVVRLGSATLTDEKLAQQSERTCARWGSYGFSVLEVPGGDYEILARVAPIVTIRQKLLEAGGRALLRAGFPLLATGEHPHWTVVCSEPTTDQFEKVRMIFDGPKINPAWRGWS